MLLIVIIPLTWALSYKLMVYLDTLIDYTQLKFLPNLLIGLLSFVARIFLPPILAFFAFGYVLIHDGNQSQAAANGPSPARFETVPSGAEVITTEEQLREFMDNHTLAEEIHTKVVGVTFNNKDGTSRQRVIARCNAGDEIRLDFYTYKGDPACAVHTPYGQIGHLPAELVARIDREYDDSIVMATIESVTGGYDGLYYGCDITIRLFTPKPEEATAPVNYEKVFDIAHRITDANEAPAEFIAAVDAVISSGNTSVSTLQRRLGLGYAVSTRLIDEMEEYGIVGPFSGSQPREILISGDEWLDIKSQIESQ